jgi:hypothetical protein
VWWIWCVSYKNLLLLKPIQRQHSKLMGKRCKYMYCNTVTNFTSL